MYIYTYIYIYIYVSFDIFVFTYDLYLNPNVTKSRNVAKLAGMHSCCLFSDLHARNKNEFRAWDSCALVRYNLNAA